MYSGYNKISRKTRLKIASGVLAKLMLNVFGEWSIDTFFPPLFFVRSQHGFPSLYDGNVFIKSYLCLVHRSKKQGSFLKVTVDASMLLLVLQFFYCFMSAKYFWYNRNQRNAISGRTLFSEWFHQTFFKINENKFSNIVWNEVSFCTFFSNRLQLTC